MTGLEIPVFSPASARAALARGASRLEINRAGSYPDGGLTPDESEVEPLSDSPVPLRVMIRPRGPPHGGRPDFVYSDAEFEEMRGAVRRFKACGHLRAERGDGLVFGVLEVVGRGGGDHHHLVAADEARNAELVRLARPLACVFHRAFDDVLGSSSSSSNNNNNNTVEETLRVIAGCGFDGILTSGGPGSAADNIGTLARILQHQHAGRAGGGAAAAAAAWAHLEIIVGGGVRSSNVRGLRDGLCPAGLAAAAASGGPRVYFHSSCLTGLSGEDVDEEEVGRIVGGLGREAPA